MLRYLSLSPANIFLFGFALLGCQTDDDLEPEYSADRLVAASANNGQIVAGAYILTYQPAQTLPKSPTARLGAAESIAEQFLNGKR